MGVSIREVPIDPPEKNMNFWYAEVGWSFGAWNMDPTKMEAQRGMNI